MNAKYACFGAFLIVAASSATAHAQKTQGAVQLGLGTPVVSYGSTKTKLEANGLEQETEVSGIQWGIRQEVMLELGYGVSDMIVVGGLIELGGSSQTQKPDDPDSDELKISQMNVALLPKIDFMFSEGQKFRPFVGAAGGLLLASTTISSGDLSNESSLTGVELLGRAGFRAFLAPGFSLDPSLFFAWNTASGTIDVGDTSVDQSSSGFSVGLMLAVSGWIL